MTATVIIEGANFTGKSTLIEALKDKYPVYRGLASLPKETIQAHELSDVISSDFYAADFIRQVKGNYVLERSILTGCIYNGVPSQYFQEQFELLPSPLVMILSAPNYVLENRMGTPEAAERMIERSIKPEDVFRINSVYRQITKRDSRFTQINTGDPDWLEEAQAKIDEHMEEHNE